MTLSVEYAQTDITKGHTMKRFWFAAAALAATALMSAPMLAQDTPPDPFQWLEQVESPEALAWVNGQNDRTLTELKESPLYPSFEQAALELFTSDDRIAYPSIDGEWAYNFWKDEKHPRGILRRTTVDSYRTETPDWDVILDVDALAEAEGTNWVYKGRNCLEPERRFCMLSLSDGGKDAKISREFDMQTRTFVEDGFVIPEAKGGLDWIDANTLYVGLALDSETSTESGYPRVVKKWKRGTPLSEAEMVFEGQYSDVSAWVWVSRDRKGQVDHTFFGRSITFHESQLLELMEDGSLQELPLPPKRAVKGILDGDLIVELRQEWDYNGKVIPIGSLIAYDMKTQKVQTIYSLGEGEAMRRPFITENTVVIPLLDNVVSRMMRFKKNFRGKWTSEEIKLPGIGMAAVSDYSDDRDDFLITFENPATPDTLYHVSRRGELTPWKSVPALYDSTGVITQQRWATSRDGTRVPYFVIGKQSVIEAGNAPTILYGYGGFNISSLPYYSGLVGQLWLERGGVYAIANIRGGGELGPEWHQSAQKLHRQRAYDDFHSVAEALIESGVTGKDRLGIQGGSNGGLLVGVAYTQRPDLYTSVVCTVPLLDMLRYHELPPGASWMSEYGDPRIPEERAAIAAYSPYQNLKANKTYPKVFFITSSKDDRVHPGHARKQAAKMEANGQPFFYFERTDGGHGAGTTPQEHAQRYALQYTYHSMLLGLSEAPTGSQAANAQQP